MVRAELFVFALSLGLSIYCLVDVLRRQDGEVPALPKMAWIVLVLLFPLVGGVAWLVMRPRARASGPAAAFPEYDRPGRAQGLSPESDAEFLRRVKARAEEQRRAYREQQRRVGEDPPESSP